LLGSDAAVTLSMTRLPPPLGFARYRRCDSWKSEFLRMAWRGDIALEGELWGEVFEPLKELAVFRSFRLDTELNTLTWPTGAHLAPEFLYERASRRPVSARD
jgi:hypothetical protein